MAASLTNLPDKRTVKGRSIRYATFPCRVYISNLPKKSPVARELAPARLRSSGKSIACGVPDNLRRPVLGPLRSPAGASSLATKSTASISTPETTKATRRWPLFGEASAKREAYLIAQPVSSDNALPMSASERTVLTPASSRAANFSSAVPLPPEMIAPAWPMRLPAGAVTPAM